MKKKVLIIGLIVILALTVALIAYRNSRGVKDGYYTAEMAEFSHGWKEYLRIQVKHGTIVSAEFNAKNESGFIKAWDNTYMKNMITNSNTYPNKYTREYVQQILDQQIDIKVDTVTGATSSGDNFKKLAEAVIQQAEAGDSKTKVVE